LINDAPKIMLFAVDPNEDLIQVPFVAGIGRRRRRLFAKLAPNFRHHRRMLSQETNDAALRQKQLDISKAQAEYVVEPDGVADQLGWKTMATIWVWRLLHSSIFAQDRAARQTRLL
jgi:hypothetical protein